ncbi:LysR family transcriptional regulator [Roseovarius spongiae]|uniref:LysR family transcriptional regulator n=1 Tax=Roseovarius spongiae TaxID=2320272 RepID=A0A3A8BAX6_9RHOB|nr:LysR family transcriptional regulator [Roseovarius spongiae]RKF16434.1 LysR family transcriptional regulator [Roseovarius spongiae]
MPTTPRLSLRAMRAFACVVEQGSISGAAGVLNIAPSAIAAAVDQVEAEIGATLLLRSRARGVASTPEAVTLAARFRALLEECDAVIEAGRAVSRGLSGTLRIGYYAPVAPAFLPRLLGPMMRAHPDLRLDLSAEDNDSAQDRLLAGRLDVILFAGHDLRPGVETRPLLDLAPYVLAPEGHPITAAAPARLADVARHPIVQLDLPLARPFLDDLFAARGLAPDIVARANSTEMVRSLVGAGIGLSVLAMRPLTDQSYGGDPLVAAPLEPGLPGFQLMSGRVADRPRRAVVEFESALAAWMDGPAAKQLTVRPPTTARR